MIDNNTDNEKWMTTAEICHLLSMSSRTLERKRKSEINPFPEPDISRAGATNKWKRKKVLEWQDRESKIDFPKPLCAIHCKRDKKGRECKKICVNGILRKTFRGLQNAYQQRAY